MRGEQPIGDARSATTGINTWRFFYKGLSFEGEEPVVGCLDVIVPQNRLLVWVGLIVLPFAALGAVVSSAAGASGALIAALGVVVLADAVLGYSQLEGLGAECAELVRMTQDRASGIELKLRNDSMKQKRLRVGLAFPREIVSPAEDITAVLPAGTQHSRVVWPCTPLKRGRYVLSQCRLETSSPLGFWAVRETVPAKTEIRVYPNLLKERSNLAALFLYRGHFGLHAQRQLGKGREFEKLREYIPGDSYEDIHWKATAKRGHPVTKIFQIERTQEVYVIVDASRLSARETEVQGSKFNVQSPPPATLNLEPGTLNTAVLERFVTAALVLGLAAERQGDLFGLLTFSDKVQRFVRAKNGQTHYGVCRDALYTLQPQIVNPDFDDVCTFIRLRLRRRALLVWLTSLDDPVLAESFVRNIELISRQHLVLVNVLQQPGTHPLFTDTGAASVDDLYGRLGGHILWHNLRELERILQRHGVQFSQLDNEKMCGQLVAQYLSVKRRQLL